MFIVDSLHKKKSILDHSKMGLIPILQSEDVTLVYLPR